MGEFDLAIRVWKPNYKPYPTMLPSTPFQVGGAFITPTQILILGVTARSAGSELRDVGLLAALTTVWGAGTAAAVLMG